MRTQGLNQARAPEPGGGRDIYHSPRRLPAQDVGCHAEVREVLEKRGASGARWPTTVDVSFYELLP